jgi:protein SCO1/2
MRAARPSLRGRLIAEVPMTRAPHRLAIAAIAIAAGLLGALAWQSWRAPAPPAPSIRGYVVAKPSALPDVALVDERGATFRPTDFAGHWSLLYFGYTYCPDVCPLTLVALAELKRRLATAPLGERVEYYLVSVDPQRDTPARLGEYVRYFDAEFRGLTGAPEALRALGAATHSVFDIPQSEGSDSYLVSHSSNVVVLSPEGELYAVLTPPHDPAQLADDLTVIAAAWP